MKLKLIFPPVHGIMQSDLLRRRDMEHTMASMDRQTHEKLEHIAQSLRDAGYDPCS